MLCASEHTIEKKNNKNILILQLCNEISFDKCKFIYQCQDFPRTFTTSSVHRQKNGMRKQILTFFEIVKKKINDVIYLIVQEINTLRQVVL